MFVRQPAACAKTCLPVSAVCSSATIAVGRLRRLWLPGTVRGSVCSGLRTAVPHALPPRSTLPARDGLLCPGLLCRSGPVCRPGLRFEGRFAVRAASVATAVGCHNGLIMGVLHHLASCHRCCHRHVSPAACGPCAASQRPGPAPWVAAAATARLRPARGCPAARRGPPPPRCRRLRRLTPRPDSRGKELLQAGHCVRRT